MPTETIQSPVTAEPRGETPVSVRPSMEDFPINKVKDDFKRAMMESDRVALIGPTGSGKTTLGPLFMLDTVASKYPDARIIVTQPKKIAVDSVASRVDETLGHGLIGYRYKNANTITDNTKIAFMVDGSLVNEITRNPTLEGWHAVMIDEIHKESEDMLDTLSCLKEAQELRKQQGKPPLLIVLATGTGNVEDMKAYLPGLIVVEAEGRLNPITPHFIKDHEVEPDDIVDEAVNIFDTVLETSPTGDKAFFMPGRSHITELVNRLKEKYKERPEISFYSITGGQQDKNQNINLKEKAQEGKIRVFVGTDVMQESITIPGLKDSIVCGYKKENIYDPHTGLSTLRLVQATKADMTQQAGRAGRDAPGNAWYLMTEGQYNARAASPTSEVQRTDLTNLVLRIKKRGKDPYTVDLMKKPPKDHIDVAVEALQKLGALDASGKITKIGEEMVEMPTDPHFARMLIEAKKRGCVEAVAVLVGFLSDNRQVFAYNPRQEKFFEKYLAYINPDSDFLTLLNVWNAYVSQSAQRGQGRTWAQRNGLSASVLYNAQSVKNELLSEEIFEGLGLDQQNKQIDIVNQSVALEIQKSIIAGLLDRVLTRGGDGMYMLANGKRKDIGIDRSSVILGRVAPLIVSGGLRVLENGRIYAGLNQVVDRKLLLEVAPYLQEVQDLKEVKTQQEEVKNEEASAKAVPTQPPPVEAEVKEKEKTPTPLASTPTEHQPPPKQKKGFWSKFGSFLKSIFTG